MLAQTIDAPEETTRIVRVVGGKQFIPAAFLNPSLPIPMGHIADSFERLLRKGKLGPFETTGLTVSQSARVYSARQAGERYPRLGFGHIYGLLSGLALEEKQTQRPTDFFRADGGSTYCFVSDRTDAPWLVRIYRTGSLFCFGGADEAGDGIELHAGSHFLERV